MHRAAGLLAAVTPQYLADAAPFFDPRVIPEVAPHIDGRVLVPAAREMLYRKDYSTEAMFVEHATPRLVCELEPAFDDDEGTIATAALVMSIERINEVLGVIPDAQRTNRLVADGITRRRCTA